jgi:DNA (cytosine-5)-methyltransferase 1
MNELALQQPIDSGLRELALFAGAGGGILGGKLLGWTTVCAVEWDAYAASVLIARQNDGILPPFPIWDDVQTFDGKPWRGRVDVVSGGFPCQDISCAGKGAGIEGERSGMWKHMARIIGEVLPRFVFVENSPTLLVRGMGDVLGGLASMGYDARWGVLGARSCGGPIERERVWIAGSNKEHGKTRLGNFKHQAALLSDSRSKCPSFWLQAPPVSIGVEHGMDSYVDQVSAIGNGQVPAVARLAWETLGGQLE